MSVVVRENATLRRFEDRARHEKDQSRGVHARHQRAVRQGRARERARAVREGAAPGRLGDDVVLGAGEEEIVDQTAAMSKNALRVLGFALKSGADLGVLETYDGTTGHPGHAVLKDPVVRSGRERPHVLRARRACATRRARKSPAPSRSDQRRHPRRGDHRRQQADRRGDLPGHRHLLQGVGREDPLVHRSGVCAADVPRAKQKKIRSRPAAWCARAPSPSTSRTSCVC